MTNRDAVIKQLRGREAETTEAAALLNLALRPSQSTRLLQEQLADGAWSALDPSQPSNTYHTALALLALRYCGGDHTASVGRGLDWLINAQPAEAHWLWKWKFRLVDRQVRFDPEKFGWPWVPGTVSWVAPTAMSILVLRAYEVKTTRLDAAVAMLLDRACPAGGWNAGNSQVYGVDLEPHPDFTAMALLALHGIVDPNAPQLVQATRYLSSRLPLCRSVYSLAWGVIAFAAYHHPTLVACTELLDRYVGGAIARTPTHTLALAALALEQPTFTFGS